MINYAIKVLSMTTDSTIDPSRPNLVTGLHINLVGIDDVTEITASLGIYIRLEAGTTFLEFNELTDEIVSNWIHGTPIIEDAKAFIIKQMAEKSSNSAAGMVAPPWIAPMTNTIYTPGGSSTSTSSGSLFNVVDVVQNTQEFRNAELEAAVQRVLTSISGGTV